MARKSQSPSHLLHAISLGLKWPMPGQGTGTQGCWARQVRGSGSLVNKGILFFGIISSRPLGPAQLPLQGFAVGLELQNPGLQHSQLLCMGALHCSQHCVFLPSFTVKLSTSGTQGRAPPGFTQCLGVSKASALSSHTAGGRLQAAAAAPALQE